MVVARDIPSAASFAATPFIVLVIYFSFYISRNSETKIHNPMTGAAASYVTAEQLRQMNYRQKLMPLHQRLVREGKIPAGFTSYKRENVEARILKAMGKPYNPDSDPIMIRAKVRACEEQMEQQNRYIDELETMLQKSKISYNKRRGTA